MRLYASASQVLVNAPTSTAVKRSTGWKNGLVLLQPVVRNGSTRWLYRINRGRKITVGICLSDVSLNSYVNQTDKGWGYYQPNGNIGHASPAKTQYGTALKPGDLIEVIVNADDGILSFRVNGKHLGPAFNIKDVVHTLDQDLGIVGAISLYEKNASVTLLQCIQVGPCIRTVNKMDNGQRLLALIKSKKGWSNGMTLIGNGVQSGITRWSICTEKGSKTTIGICVCFFIMKFLST